MLTRLTKNLTFISRIFSQNFGILFLSLILSNSHQISAQEEQQETFDQNIVNSGESLFKGNCTVCHAINEVVIGPALRDVHERQSEEWIYAFIKNSQKVIKSGDEYAVDLYNQYNQTLMTSFDFSDDELNAILTYIKSESVKEVQVAVVDNAVEGGEVSSSSISSDHLPVLGTSANSSYLPYKIPIPLGPQNLCALAAAKSTSKSTTFISLWGADWAISIKTLTPLSWQISIISFAGLVCPSKFEVWTKLNNLVLEFNENRTFNSNFSHTIFQTVSLLTGTGFTTTNYALWPKMSIFVLLLIMFMGGCAGSTTGGMKTVRIMLLFKALKRELLLVIHPRAIIKLRIGKKVLDESLFRNVGVFFFIFIIIFLI